MALTKKPTPHEEFKRIQCHYPMLSSTGCTRSFCQSGRMVHTDERKLGQDSDYETVEQDAIDFLQQLRRDGIIKSDAKLQNRKETALKEIRSNSIKMEGNEIPGTWHHTYEELQHGIRLAWKHARKCIMRSEYSYLMLGDLRHITTSKGMGEAILDGMHKAFNKGDIQPSVFVFHPKKPNSPGPMIWNQQLLAFAGYRQPDKTVLGDPANATLTDDIIALGWEPPAVRTQWDLLPLVTMMDGDEPYITPIPKDYFPLVPIRHPKPEYSLAFDKLGLRWVPAPALSQLGFDMGGVQYTASPFIGWFMDAEIGVRDLADSFRYNVLPDVVSALGLLSPGTEFDELPQSDRLALLSHAQTELSYAVNWSFAQAEVRMSDSLTASAMYTQFDDDHMAKHGFRLPSDPYWIAPPQGSIIPIWHRGAAPNYQPKPMICRLKENPIKVWKRSKRPESIKSCPYKQETEPKQSIMPNMRILYCSSGTTAQRLAVKLQQKIDTIVGDVHDYFTVAPAAPLNNFDIDSVTDQDVFFVIASSSGHGDVPTNGQVMLQKLKAKTSKASFCVFGNGNSSYGDNFNGAAKKLQTVMENAGLTSSLPLFEADTLKEDPPWRQFNSWLSLLKNKFGDSQSDAFDTSEEEEPDDDTLELLMNQLSPAKVISVQAPNESGIKLVSLDIGNLQYGPMSHIDVFVPLQKNEVDNLLWTARFSGQEEFSYGDNHVNTRGLFSLVDPKHPFKNLQWTRKLQMEVSSDKMDELSKGAMSESIRNLPFGWQAKAKAKNGGFLHFFSSLPIARARTFSAASSQGYWDSLSTGGVLELLVQTHVGGHFTERFLSTAKSEDELYIRIRRGPGEHLIHEDKPLIAFTTGSGIAPLRGLLQGKCAHILERQAEANTAKIIRKSPISLFLGFAPRDNDMIAESVREAQTLGLVDMLHMMPSNPRKERAQDQMFQKSICDQIRTKIQEEGANVFVCASQAAADDFARNLEAIVGVKSIREALGERWVEEVYVFKPE